MTTMRDLDDFATASIEVMAIVGIAYVVLVAVFRKPRRHVMSAEFKSSDLSAIIRKKKV